MNKGCGSLETPAMINNYVDLLKVPCEKQTIINVEQSTDGGAINETTYKQSMTESDQVLISMTNATHNPQPNYVISSESVN